MAHTLALFGAFQTRAYKRRSYNQTNMSLANSLDKAHMSTSSCNMLVFAFLAPKSHEEA